VKLRTLASVMACVLLMLCATNRPSPVRRTNQPKASERLKADARYGLLCIGGPARRRWRPATSVQPKRTMLACSRSLGGTAGLFRAREAAPYGGTLRPSGRSDLTEICDGNILGAQGETIPGNVTP